jgi:hypothetical protein
MPSTSAYYLCCNTLQAMVTQRVVQIQPEDDSPSSSTNNSDNQERALCTTAHQQECQLLDNLLFTQPAVKYQ